VTTDAPEQAARARWGEPADTRGSVVVVVVAARDTSYTDELIAIEFGVWLGRTRPS